MKARLILILLIWNASSTGLDLRLQFQQWQMKYDRNYLTEGEFHERFNIFVNNFYKVQQMNSDKTFGDDVTFEINQYADMTESEFQMRILMPANEAKQFPPERYLTPPTIMNLPQNFDWREHGAVTDVKDQGASGTCWTFSTTGNVEGQNFLKTGKLVALSEEQLVDCDGSFDVESKHADCGVFGGWPYLAFEYIMKSGGLDLEEEYPYCVGGFKNQKPCYPCMPPGWNEKLCGPPVSYCDSVKYPCRTTRSQQAVKIVNWGAISTDEDDIAAELIARGPLSVALNASGLQFYRSGVFNPLFCDPKSLDHAVLLVGFGQSLTGTNYWLVKNSWGTGWGDKGYFKILRGKGKCGINQQVSTAIL